MTGRVKRLALWTVAALLASASPAIAGTLQVDDDHAQCPDAQFTSIEAAVQAAAPNDTVQVCAGVYQETVTIDKPGLKVYSTPRQAAVIKAPPVIPTLTGAIVDITAPDVELHSFTITGPGGGPCNSLRYGVFVGNNGSADIRDNRITQIRDNPLGGCQNGVAVRVGSSFLGQVGHATVFGNFIDNYQKAGVVVDGPNTTATVQQNRIEGSGPTGTIAQLGIQISRSATADVEGNVVEDNSYVGTQPASASGILLYQVSGSGVIVQQNEATRNDDNLDALTTTGTLIEQNDFWQAAQYDGIYMDTDTADNVLRLNYMRNNPLFDCEDEGANTWINDDGVTQNRPGICNPNGGEKPGRQREPNRHVEPYL